ncbi:MAG: type IV secretion system DNA-binding domain-containing protein [Oscillospiraceae bacterium]|nr:type IV secretion system DNA-binding domain-containing protein [Oscillospiraceae bacterium]
MNELFLVFIIIIIVIFFISIYKFIFGDSQTIFDFKSDVEKAIESPRKQEKITEEKTLIGTAGRNRQIFINNNAKHVFVLGTTGSGKSVALCNFIKSGQIYGYPMLIVDGKGSTDTDSLLAITKKLCPNRKIYVINFNDPEHSDKYNPFKDTEEDVIRDMLMNMTDWSEEHYKYNTEIYIQQVIKLLSLSDIVISLKSITDYLPPEKFLKLSQELQRERLISKEEHNINVDLVKNSGTSAEGAAARFALIQRSGLGTIFDESGIDIYTALKEKAVIIFILNALKLPEMSPLLGRLIVIDSKKAVGKLFENKFKRVFFIFDEINVYASEPFLDLINKSRAANITCVLATQSLSDLDAKAGEPFRKQVIENSNNYILMRQNEPDNAEKCAEIVGTQPKMEVTYQMNEGGSTGLGSAKLTRQFIYHPDQIKHFGTGEAIFVSKDSQFHTKVNIHKCF